MIDLMKRLYTALQTFLGNVATNDSVDTAIETAVEALDIPTDQEIQGMIDTSVQALDIPTDQEIQGMIDTSVQALDIPAPFTVASYATPEYVENYTEEENSVDGVRFLLFENKWRKVMGLFKVTQAFSGKLFSAPAGYGYWDQKMGNMQGWFAITNTSTGDSYACRMYSNDIYSLITIPIGSYQIDFMYIGG